MKDTIKQLEAQSRFLELDFNQREAIIRQVSDYSQSYLENIARASTYTMPDHIKDFNQVANIAENGIPMEQILALLSEHVDNVGINVASGRYVAYIPGGGLFPSSLGDYLAGIANRYAGWFDAGPGAVQVENALIRWMASEIGYPAQASGNLTSGGSIANLIAIITARDTHQISGDNIPKSVIYVTSQAHHCIDKALHVSGLQACIKRLIVVDSAQRMDAVALENAIQADKQAGLNPFLVIGNGGTTNTGSVDPLSDIGEIAHAHDCWFHVDGAYGGLFMLCPEGHEALRGIDTSDSLVIDPHKTLFLPYGLGTVLVRDRQKQIAAFRASADYMQDILDDDSELSPNDLSPELTKHFRGLRLWLPLKLFGVHPFRAALSEKIHLARYFYEQMQSADGFELGTYPDLSVVTYRYCPKRGSADEFNQRLMQSIQQEGRVFISSTRVDGKFVLRAAILSFRTHLDEIDEVITVLKRHAQALEQTS